MLTWSAYNKHTVRWQFTEEVFHLITTKAHVALLRLSITVTSDTVTAIHKNVYVHNLTPLSDWISHGVKKSRSASTVNAEETTCAHYALFRSRIDSALLSSHPTNTSRMRQPRIAAPSQTGVRVCVHVSIGPTSIDKRRSGGWMLGYDVHPVHPTLQKCYCTILGTVVVWAFPWHGTAVPCSLRNGDDGLVETVAGRWVVGKLME